MALGPFDSHLETEAVESDEVDASAARPAGKAQAQSFDHVGVVSLEVMHPRAFDPAERVGSGGENAWVIDDCSAGGVGEDDRVHGEDEQAVVVADVEQGWVGVGPGDRIE